MADSPQIHTAAQLNALPYNKAAFGQGMTLEDYRKQFRLHGERIRHDRAFPGVPLDAVGPGGETTESNGTLYVQNVLAPEIRVLISQTQADITDSEWGTFKTGSTSIACCLDELELARLDRVTLLDREVFGRQVLKPEVGAAFSELDWPFVSSIVHFSGAGNGILSTDASGRSSIVWIGAPPAYCLIELRYHPRYIWLAQSDKYPPLDPDGKPLPQRGILTLENRKPNVNINF